MNRLASLIVATIALCGVSVSAQDNVNASGFTSNAVFTVTATNAIAVIGENVGMAGRRAMHITFPTTASAGVWLLPCDGNNAANLAAAKARLLATPNVGLHLAPGGPIIGWTWDAHDLWQKTVIAISDTAGSNAVINIYEPRGAKP